jgi:hypothetical protein
MNRRLLWGVALTGATLFGCTDHNARQDLPVANQTNDLSQSLTVVMPDAFPNVTHKCVTFAGIAVGFWTTTDRTLIMIYNDHACPGSNVEQDMTVINGVPRAIVNAG